MSGDRQDLYAELPLRVLEALRRGDLTFDQFGLAAFFVTAADYRTHEYTGYREDIRRDARWEKSDDTLLRAMVALRSDRWVEFESHQGKRTRYVVRLTGLLRRRDNEGTGDTSLPHREALSCGSGAEVTSAVRRLEEHAIQREERDDDAAELPYARKRPSTSTSLRRGEDVLGGEDQGEDKLVRGENREKAAGAPRFDDDELRVLTDQAFEMRDTAWAPDASNSIVELYDRRALGQHEREQEENVVSSEPDLRSASNQPQANEGNE